MTIPAWKAFEDKKIKEDEEKEEKLSLFFLKEYLEKQQIPFTEGELWNLVSIKTSVLISRKEIIKILLLTKGRLGIQFFNGEIGIYKLHTKIKK
jgi:hypothetical protein